MGVSLALFWRAFEISGGGKFEPPNPPPPWYATGISYLPTPRVLAVNILTERYNNNVDKNKWCWTYRFTKSIVIAPGTLNFVFTFLETAGTYLIWTSLKKNHLTDDFFKVEAPVIQWALIVVVMWEVSVNTHSLVSSFHTYQHGLDINCRANSVRFFPVAYSGILFGGGGGGWFNKFSWGQRT